MGLLGKRLRALRESKQLSQIEVGRLLRITSASVSAYELAKREPDHDTLTKLADLYNTSADYLLGRTDDPRPFAALEPLPPEIDANADEAIALIKTLPPEEAAKALRILEAVFPEKFTKSGG